MNEIEFIKTLDALIERVILDAMIFEKTDGDFQPAKSMLAASRAKLVDYILANCYIKPAVKPE